MTVNVYRWVLLAVSRIRRTLHLYNVSVNQINIPYHPIVGNHWILLQISFANTRSFRINLLNGMPCEEAVHCAMHPLVKPTFVWIQLETYSVRSFKFSPYEISNSKFSATKDISSTPSFYSLQCHLHTFYFVGFRFGLGRTSWNQCVKYGNVSNCSLFEFNKKPLN